MGAFSGSALVSQTFALSTRQTPTTVFSSKPTVQTELGLGSPNRGCDARRGAIARRRDGEGGRQAAVGLRRVGSWRKQETRYKEIEGWNTIGGGKQKKSTDPRGTAARSRKGEDDCLEEVWECGWTRVKCETGRKGSTALFHRQLWTPLSALCSAAPSCLAGPRSRPFQNSDDRLHCPAWPGECSWRALEALIQLQPSVNQVASN